MRDAVPARTLFRMLDMTALILTANEEANIGRTLDRLRWMSEVVILDSGSTDRTLEIAASYSNVRVVIRAFDSHAEQWTFGFARCGIDAEWILGLDADFLLSDTLIAELQVLEPPPGVSAFSVNFSYSVFGRELRGSLYPSKPVLMRRNRTRFAQDGHTQVCVTDDGIAKLEGHIVHDDRKPLGRWLQSQSRYMAKEADKLLATDRATLALPDRLRLMLVIAPLAACVYTLLVRGCILDGWPGIYYATERTVAEAILSLELMKRRLLR